MKFKLQSKDISKYLLEKPYLNCMNPEIVKISDYFRKTYTNKELLEAVYNYVRDDIKHSIDINETSVTYIASDILKLKHGICYAKTHLLASIYRSLGIPCGFSYQKLILDDNTNPELIIHSLNAIFLKDINKWIRLDARGSKPGVNAQFCIEKEIHALPTRAKMGEYDYLTIYHTPPKSIIQSLKKAQNVDELYYKFLPKNL